MMSAKMTARVIAKDFALDLTAKPSTEKARAEQDVMGVSKK
jgi:hypothetical protein